MEKVKDGNIHILKQQLSGLWEQENHLTLVPGYTGNVAKDVGAYLLQLHWDVWRTEACLCGLHFRNI